MKKIIVLLLVVIVNGCATPSLIPLKGNYSNVVKTFYTDKSKDEVWSNVVELFSTNGLGISIIDKSSGLIVSNNTSFMGQYTRENNMGNLNNPKAFIVVDKYDTNLGVLSNPMVVTGVWNIRLFEKDGKVGININLTNLTAYSQQYLGTMYGNVRKDFNAKSTGIFEKMIAQSLKL